MRIEIPAGRHGPARPREVDAQATVRVDLRIPAWLVRELTLRASHRGQSRNAHIEQLLTVAVRRDRGDPILPASRDGTHDCPCALAPGRRSIRPEITRYC